MAIITYDTPYAKGCIFSSMGTVEETEIKLAYIMEGCDYTITSRDQDVAAD